jgi:DNA (cytosine-5)-methyltransferase 1
MAVEASDHPILKAKPSITDFRDANWTRLSDRALRGFIRRAVEGGLRMPEGFLDALRNASRKDVCLT